MAAKERRKIVVIEDDDEVRGLIRHVLQGGGYAALGEVVTGQWRAHCAPLKDGRRRP